MRKLIIWTGFIIPSFIVLVSFQNCSKIQTEDLLKEQVGKLTNAVIDTDDLPPSPSIVSVDQEGKKDLPTPKPPVGGGEAPADPNIPLCTSYDVEGNPVIAHCQVQPGQPPKLPPRVEEEDEKDDKELVEARLHCKMAREKGWVRKLVSKVAHIEEVNEDKSYDGLSGRHIFLSGPNRSKILNIRSMKGFKVFCDLEIDNIEDSEGRIILINSHIREMKKHKGHLDLIDSRVEKVEKSECQVKKHLK